SQRGAGRDSIDERRAARFVDERFQILDLALDGIRRLIAAVAPAPAVVAKHGEAVRQLGRQRFARSESAMAKGAVHQDERRPLAGAFERDRSAVFGSYLVHV